ncbi:MAG TPA: hypothetical protein VK112_10965 [Fodinibius sp.]|nr:hypothetical protein [Fodinibius sp.]
MKKPTRYLLLLLFLGLMTHNLQAQVAIKQVDFDENTDGNSISEEEMIRRLSGIIPIGNLQLLGAEANHVANIHLEGNRNYASINQQGSSNIGIINIIGSGNQADLAQDGTNLLSLMDIEGNGNMLDSQQEGNNVGSLVRVEGSGLKINLLQNESGFQYSQAGYTNPLTITTSQRYVPIIIKNN